MTYTPNTYTDFKNSVRVASTGNVNVSSPGASIDGITLAVGNRVLLKDQSTPAQNGIYVWKGAATPMVRGSDADQSGELTAGSATYVEQGTVSQKKTYTLTTTGTIVVGTTPLVYEELTPSLATSFLNDLGDVDTTGVVDGALFRYDSTGSQWNDTPSLLLDDNGRLRVTTTGASAGIELGGDVSIYRSGANVIALGAGDKIQQNAVPSVNDDLTNKLYVDTLVSSGIHFHPAADLATTGNITLSGEQTIDGTLTSSSRVLVKNQGTASQNGIYNTSAGPWTRAVDMDSPAEADDGSTVWVQGGSANANTQWTQTSPVVTLEVDSLTFFLTASAATVTTLDSLSDVDTSGVNAADMLYFNGTNWVDTTGLSYSDAGGGINLTGTVPGVWMEDVPAGATAGALMVTDSTSWQIQKRASGLGAFVNAPISVELQTGSEAITLSSVYPLRFGADVQLSRTAANTLAMGAGDKIQQNAAPTVNDDLTNKLYVDNSIAAATPDFNQAFRRSWFGVG